MRFGELSEYLKPLGEKPGIDGAALRDAAASGLDSCTTGPVNFRFSSTESIAI